MTTARLCLAFDFGGTIAAPGRSPNGHDVHDTLYHRFRTTPPPALADVIDQLRLEAAQAYRRHGRQTPWRAIVASAADRVGLALDDVDAVTDALWDIVPDGRIDPAACETIKHLHRQGYTLLLACNTQRAEHARLNTLAKAGLDQCFAGWILSGTLGVAKPDPAFYAAVAEAARATAGLRARDIISIGDTWYKDVVGPQQAGMRAVHVRPDAPTPSMSRDTPIVPHVTDLPALLRRWP